MIAVTFDNNSQSGVLLRGPGGLQSDPGLASAILISLFTDRRVDPEEAEGDRRGWIGDALSEVEADRIGSRLWLLKREKATEETRLRALEYAAEALAWMVETALVTGFEIDAEWITREMLAIHISWSGALASELMVVPLRVGIA
jgi:phage gp46-like protein